MCGRGPATRMSRRRAHPPLLRSSSALVSPSSSSSTSSPSLQQRSSPSLFFVLLLFRSSSAPPLPPLLLLLLLLLRSSALLLPLHPLMTLIALFDLPQALDYCRAPRPLGILNLDLNLRQLCGNCACFWRILDCRLVVPVLASTPAAGVGAPPPP